MATGSISSIGIGSGLDAENIVSQLVAIKKKSLTKLESSATTIKSKISAMGSLNTAVSNLQDQIKKLSDANLWQTKTVTSSNTAALTGTVTNKAAVGSYEVAVTQLATSQSVNSQAFAKDAAMGKGVLSITMGTWTNGALVPASDTSKNLVLDDLTGNETLSEIAAKINAKGVGVTAAIVRDASGERLSLTSNATGAKNAFEVEVTASGSDPVGANLAKLAFAGAGVPGGMTQGREALDTVATVNGIEVKSSNLVLSDVVDGLTLTVSKLTEANAPARITIAQDTASAKQAISNLATSYSSLMSTLSTMMAYDPESGSAGTLQGDATARTLQSAMRRLIQNTGGADTQFQSLSQIGVQLTKDGKLEVNDAKLTAALKDPEGLKNFFSVDAPGQDQDGWAVRAYSFTQGLLDTTQGMFASANTSLNAQLKSNSSQLDSMQRRISAYETNLRATYSALDTKMSKMNALNTYVTQQVAQWNKSSG